MSKFGTLYITIQAQTKSGNYYPVIAEYNSSDKARLENRNEGKFDLKKNDLNKLEDLALSHEVKKYGEYLGELLFKENIRDVFVSCFQENEEFLRVLLFIEAKDVEVNNLRWECLCAPMDGNWEFLRKQERTPYSVHIPSMTDRLFPPIGTQDLRALVLVAAPKVAWLDDFDTKETVESIRTALGSEIPFDVLAFQVDGAVGLPTWDHFKEQLKKHSYTFLHFVCHGALSENQEPILYWAKSDNSVDIIKGEDLIQKLRNIKTPKGLPHFAFFVPVIVQRFQMIAKKLQTQKKNGNLVD